MTPDLSHPARVAAPTARWTDYLQMARLDQDRPGSPRNRQQRHPGRRSNEVLAVRRHMDLQRRRPDGPDQPRSISPGLRCVA